MDRRSTIHLSVQDLPPACLVFFRLRGASATRRRRRTATPCVGRRLQNGQGFDEIVVVAFHNRLLCTKGLPLRDQATRTSRPPRGEGGTVRVVTGRTVAHHPGGSPAPQPLSMGAACPIRSLRSMALRAKLIAVIKTYLPAREQVQRVHLIAGMAGGTRHDIRAGVLQLEVPVCFFPRRRPGLHHRQGGGVARPARIFLNLADALLHIKGRQRVNPLHTDPANAFQMLG